MLATPAGCTRWMSITPLPSLTVFVLAPTSASMDPASIAAVAGGISVR